MSDETLVADEVAVETTEDTAEVSEETTQAEAELAKTLDAKFAEPDATEDDADNTDNSEDDTDTEAVEGDGDEPTDDEPTESEPGFTPKQLNAMKRFGVDSEELEAMGEAGVALADKLAKMHSDYGRMTSEIGKAKAALKAGDTEPEEKSFSPEEWGEEAADRLNSMDARLAKFESYYEQEQNRRTEQEYDNYFAGLSGTDYPQFGKGSMSELIDDSPEAVARNTLIDKAREIQAGRQVVTGNEMPMNEALSEALAVVAAGSQEKIIRKKLKKEVTKRSKQLTSRPSGVGPKTAAQSEKDIEKALDAKFKARGYF